MLRLYRASLFSVIAILWLLTPASIPAQQTESLAILDLEGRGISTIEAASLTDRLRTALVRIGGITVVERGQMEQILGEQDFQLTGCTSNECAVEVGQLLGVTSMVAGSIGKVGSTFSIDIRTVDVQSGRITHSLWRDYRGEIDGLLGIMPEIAGELVIAIAAAEPPPESRAPEAPTPASIAIITQPPGAAVALDSLEVGMTPLDGVELEPDRSHAISLSLDGYQPADTTFFAEAGRYYKLSIPLMRLPSRLTVTSDPPGAAVTLDGQDAGTTPLDSAELEPDRSHAVVINLDGYQPVDTTLFTDAGQSYELSIPLVGLASRLTITSIPSGAMVFLDNRRLRATPLSLPEVAPDTQHRISLWLNGYQRIDTTFFAIAGEHHRLDIALQPVAVAATAVTRPEAPLPETQQPQLAVKPAKAGGGRTLVVLALLAATGYYGYTQGWFGEKPPDEGLRVGNPPSVPSQ